MRVMREGNHVRLAIVVDVAVLARVAFRREVLRGLQPVAEVECFLVSG